MADNEFVYIICQNARTGKVLTVQDNRERLEEEMMNNSQSSEVKDNTFAKLAESAKEFFTGGK
jgi:hypothetical protein